MFEFAEALKRLVLSEDVDSLDAFDPELLEQYGPLVRRTLGAYFRASVTGLEKIPEGPAMIVGNHNAGITFLEPFVFGTEFYMKRGTRERLYFLGHDAMMHMPGLGRVLHKGGTIRASKENGAKVLEAGHKMVVFPGGNYEAFRTFKDRYKVDFGGHKGFASLAIEKNVPVVPLLSVGGHETFFVLRRGHRLGKLLGTDKLLRSKAFPITVCLPWGLAIGPIFHLPLPAKSDIVLGDPIRPSELTADVPAEKKADVLYDAVVGRLQTMMDEAASHRKTPVLG